VNSVGLNKGKSIEKGDSIFIDNIQRFADAVAVLTQLVEMLSLETLLTVKMKKSQIYLMGTRRTTVSIIEQQQILFLKMLLINSIKNLSPRIKRFKM
jgi:hypothetical protein